MEENLARRGYDHTHRAFLQALLARGTVTFEESQSILAAIVNVKNGEDGAMNPEQVSQDLFESYLNLVSEAASMFDYEIRSTVHQLSKQRVYALVNTNSDPQTQLATTYNAEELAFIKRLLDGIFDKYNRPRMEVLAITEMQAIKFARPNRRPSQAGQTEPSTDKGLKHSEVERVLAGLVDGGWLEKSRSGFYSVTPRALLELRPWLIDMYNDADAGQDDWQRIKFCEACKDIVTAGLRCADPACTFRLHEICQEAFWRVRRTTSCSKCEREWTGANFVGEKAVTSTEAYQRGRRRGGGRRSTLADQVMENQGLGDGSDGDQ
ncbi:Nse1 non-SMC component of SMC5-6 complex [Ophiocordyceps camponoti-floridani]|uniref:Non-structural maintenance of chromosomes element 1 homolog n=1 Tax=Ophiocordyceps camponoti-floridani TaxID=2030778 RepID=A0A8H4VD55_9HYPO|nr:Nse1 non-SMC component of SMC5-6 complex [Ophiocordyceps camponoti-floridani]